MSGNNEVAMYTAQRIKPTYRRMGQKRLKRYREYRDTVAWLRGAMPMPKFPCQDALDMWAREVNHVAK